MRNGSVPWYIDVLFEIATPLIALVGAFFLWRSEVFDRLEAADRHQRLVASEDEARRLRIA